MYLIQRTYNDGFWLIDWELRFTKSCDHIMLKNSNKIKRLE